MERINIKPLSVNEAYTGRRKKTEKYKAYKTSMMYLLPKIKIPKGNLHVIINFGFSSKGSDLDNPTKQFLDCLQAKYGINDNLIYRIELNKFIVPKKQEYIEFKINKL